MVSAQKMKLSLAALLASASIGTAHAVPIVDTGASLDGSDSAPALALFGYYGWADEQQFMAGRFTIAEDTQVTGLSAYVRGYSDKSANSEFSLAIASGPFNPTRATFTNLLEIEASYSSQDNSAQWAGGAVDNFLLSAGTYWLVAFVKEGQYAAGLGMPLGVGNPMDQYAYFNSDLDRWFGLADPVPGMNGRGTLGFRLDGVAVPEPGTLGMMMAAFAGAMLLMRRRRQLQI